MGNGVKSLCKSFFSSFLHVIYPNICCSCGLFLDRDKVFCGDCFKKIGPIAMKSVYLNKEYSIKTYSVSLYDGVMRKMILQKKARGIRAFSSRLASVQLADTICRKLKIFDEGGINSNLSNDCVIIPVPLHWSRHMQRGFNQSSVIGQFLSKETKIPMIDILKRNRKTEFQSNLSKVLRQKNVENAFVIRKKFRNRIHELIKNKHLFIVDDLATTGATLKSVANALLEGEPREISAVVACRAG